MPLAGGETSTGSRVSHVLIILRVWGLRCPGAPGSPLLGAKSCYLGFGPVVQSGCLWHRRLHTRSSPKMQSLPWILLSQPLLGSKAPSSWVKLLGNTPWKCYEREGRGGERKENVWRASGDCSYCFLWGVLAPLPWRWSFPGCSSASSTILPLTRQTEGLPW